MNVELLFISNGILEGLISTTNTWRPIAIFWHLFFGIMVVSLLAGLRPSKRTCGIPLSIPLLGVGILALLSLNPFNGFIFTVIGIVMILISRKLPAEKIQIAPLWGLIPGIGMLLFGWVYPHFLDTASPLSFLYSAPTGIIPCPTLSIVIGLTLILDGLDSCKLSLILGGSGIFYGITGVVLLGVTIDWILFLGAVTILTYSLIKKYRVRPKKAGTKQNKMNAWGIGPKLAFLSLLYLVLASFFHFSRPDIFTLTQIPFTISTIVGTLLIVVGLTMWACGARIIDKAFTEGRLITTGVYALVRNPMYSGFIVFIAPGIALWFRSWILLTVPVIAYIIFKMLIKSEDTYLEKKFGQEFLEYKTRVNALIPFPYQIVSIRTKKLDHLN